MTDQLESGRTEPDYVELTADIVSAYVTHNSVRSGDVADLIGSVHAALRQIGSPALREASTKPTPPINPKKSITADFLISLEDGRPYKSLKRHLKGRGLTPELYREKWGLPSDYPMVAANYAQKRSELAKKLGLGQIRTKLAQKAAAVDEKVTGPAVKKARRRVS